MGAWIIWLLLFCCNSGCSDNGNNRSNERSCGCDGDNNNNGRGRDRDCGCDKDNNNSRFESRFDTRPFGNRETCGCEDKD